jgi:hypothetical protein
VLDQHALAGSRRAEDHRDLVVGQPEVEAVEDPGAAELLDQVDDLDRIDAAVVALQARVPAIGVGLARVDAGDRVVAVQAAELGRGLLVGARRSPGASSAKRSCSAAICSDATGASGGPSNGSAGSGAGSSR